MMADELSDAGLDMRKVLKPEVEIPWTKQSVKDHLFRPVMQAMLNKDSTTELTTQEIDLVFNTVNRHLGKFGCSFEFPSIETIINQQRLKDVQS